jgi:ssDNA-binding Zn-finger/Zn-ribbon topoisomerase 1
MTRLTTFTQLNDMAKILKFTREQNHKFVQCWKCRGTALIDKKTGVPWGKENDPSCWIRLYIEENNIWIYECPHCD